ncbi:MAG: hypothetical protein ACODAQ_11275 [Phycisphaeraceae bacterium]
MTQADAPFTAIRPASTDEALAATDNVCAAAMARAGDEVRDIYLRFAGEPVHMRVAGPVLADYMALTFEHLQDTSAAHETPALRIDMWDRAHTGLGCPGVPCIPDATICLDAGLITHYLDQHVIRYERGHCTMVLDRVNQRIYSCRNDGNDLALYERSKPFPIMLATWYQDQGIQQLHAGLVSKNGRGVLFIGASGSGKSTATLACALDGFDYLGDDHNGLRLDEDGVCWGYSYYNAARIGDGHLRHFPELAPHEVPPHCQWDEKSLVYMSQVIPERMVAQTRIDAVVLPRIVGGPETRIRKASRLECLLALAPSTLKIPLSPGIDGLMNLTDFIPRIACYRLELGDDVRQIPGCVEDILNEAPAPEEENCSL